MARFSVAEDEESRAKRDDSRFGAFNRDEAGARQREREEVENEASSIRVMSRKSFVAMFAREYTPAHVTLIGPTQRGKTTLCFELLHAVLKRNPKWKVLIIHGKVKGRDHTIEENAKTSNYRIVRSYPPGFAIRPKHWKRNVNGYVLRPLGKKEDSAVEEERILKREFGKGIRSFYHTTGKDKVRITVVDERAQADKDLKLGKELDAPLQRGLPHNPEWNNIQRGAWCSYHCYDAPEHIFLFVDDDDSNIDRYAQFGVGDPRVIKKVMSELKVKKVPTGGTISQCLYMRRSDRFMCIVDT